MPKTTSIPRISIVIPLSSDTTAFEDTLASVLQNRPAASEILVAHHGHYDDPFDLSDEVRFVTAESPSLIDSIHAGASEAKAQFVHVLAPGFHAIEDWTVRALENFQNHDTAVVAPVIRGRNNQHIVAAGWCDTTFRLCQPVAASQQNLQRKQADHVLGAYLQASFWRRSVLQSMATAFPGGSINEASYAFGQLAMNAGWQCALATECEVTTSLNVSDWDKSSFARGRQFRAIRTAIARTQQRMPLLANLVRSITRPNEIAETFGQANYRGRLAAAKRNLQVAAVAEYRNPSVINMHGAGPATASLRRAA